MNESTLLSEMSKVSCTSPTKLPQKTSLNVGAFLTRTQLNYVKLGVSEYELTLRNCYAHERKYAQKNTFEAPNPLPLRIQNIRGLLHH